MMKTIYKIAVAILSVAALSGCNDKEFLTEKPEYFYTVDNAFSTSSQVDAALTACYSHIRVMNNMSEENNNSFVYKGGNGTDMFDVATIRRSNQFNNYAVINAENGVIYTIYSWWYQLIAKANLALYGADLETIAWGSSQEQAYAKAQARFFRAWAYRNLGEEFGGVPIVTEMTTSPRYDFARATRVETYQYAIDELEDILNDLPETTPTNGKIVKGAAIHTLCQLYLDKGIALEEEGNAGEAKSAYAKSVEYGDKLINGSTYRLMTERFGTRLGEHGPTLYFASSEAAKTPETLYSAAGVDLEANVYWDLFQPGNQDYQDGNYESIWTIQQDYNANLKEDGQSKLQYSRVYGPVFRDPMSSICTGTMEDVGGRGICQVMPTVYTRDIVYEGKWAEDMRNSEVVLRRTFLGNVPGNEYYGKVIPWSVLNREGQAKDAVDVALTQVYPVSCKIATDNYIDDKSGGNKSNLYRDEYIIRLPETILLRAEAKMRNGDNAGAADDINILRKRAKCGYLVTAGDVNLDLILDERARELVYEETRWNTLLRMGGTVAVDRIKKYAYWDEPRTNIPAFNLWPIPQTVIDTNKDVEIKQNPGW